jgi:hypothetical protein
LYMNSYLKVLLFVAFSLFGSLLYSQTNSNSSIEEKGIANNKEETLKQMDVNAVEFMKEVIKKGATPGNPIPSLPASFCSSDGIANITHATWPANGANIIWQVYTEDGGGIKTNHPDWYTISGTGSSTVLNFDPSKVTSEFYGAPIFFFYTIVDISFGYILDLGDFTVISSNPIAYNFSGSTEICPGSTAALNISNSEVGMQYFIYRGASLVNFSPIAGTGSAINYPVSIAGTYTMQARNASNITCTTNMIGSATIVVNSRPTSNISVSGTNPICIGQSSTISVALTGIGPWNLTYTDGTTPQTVNSILVSPYTYNVSPLTTTTYSITALNDSKCTANAIGMSGSATVTVNPLPTSIISGTTAICNGNSTPISIALTGTAPWNLTYTTNGAPTTVNNIAASPYTFNVTPVVNTTYLVTALSDANTCGALGAGMTGSALVSIRPRPTGVISGSSTVCNGTVSPISIALTGSAPWNVTYTANGVPTSVVANASPYVINVSPSATTTYLLTGLSDANCTALAGDLSGSAVKTINPRPTSLISGDATTCNGGSTMISVALTGTGPWNLTYTANGTPVVVPGIVANPYSFNVNPAVTTTYVVTALADANCTSNAGDLTGTATVTVNARPTSVISGTTALCNGSSTIINIALTGTAPWNVTYTTNGVPTTVNNVGSSPLIVNVTPVINTTYVITALTDANCSANAGDMTGSAVVTVHPLPTSNISGTATICNGGTTPVSIALTGSSPWSVTYTVNGVPTTVNGILASPYVISTAPSATTTYLLTAVSDANCSANALGMTGSATVTVNPRPTSVISGTATICNGSSTTISIALTGTAPWNLTYTTNGAPTTVNNIVASPYTFIASPIVNTTYLVTALSDANSCGANAGDMTGSAVVTLRARPTGVISGSSTVCNGTASPISIALTGSTPWNVTYTSNGVPTTVIANSSPFVINVTPAVTTTYLLTGLTDANCTALAIDLSGTAVKTVNQRPTSVISGDAATCNGGSTTISVALTGTGPWNLTYTANGTPVVVSGIVANPYTFIVSPAVTTTYVVTALTDANCVSNAGDRTGTATVTANHSFGNQYNCLCRINLNLSG